MTKHKNVALDELRILAALMVLGVQRHNHVHFGNALVICNISGQKSQFIIAVFFRKGIAACDHIFFQIQSDHTDIIAI